MFKKLISTALAAAVLLTSTAFAYTDVPSTDAGFEAISMISNLKLMEGFDDGSFRPDDVLTRSELAKIIVIAMDQYPKDGETPFTDVPDDHWAAGWIYTAYVKGIINGCGDGTFRPDNPVTYEEGIKMIVCALGYEAKAQKMGGWPVGYLSLAAAERITARSGGKLFTPLTRRQFAILLYNSLEVEICDGIYWDPNVLYAPKASETLMSRMINRINRDTE